MIKYIEEIFNGYDIRTVIDENNNKHYCVIDILKALDYDIRNISKTIEAIPDKWSHTEKFRITGKDGKTYIRDLLFISREGLHLFLERSTKPKARDFQEWLAGPVLTSIEDIGGYIDPDIVNESTLSIDNMRRIIEISNARTRELEYQRDQMEFYKQSYEDTSRILNATDSEAKRIADQATFEADAYRREKDRAWDKIGSLEVKNRDLTQRISYLESKLSENNIAYSDTHPKVEMCRIVDNTHKKTNIMDIINGYKGE